MSKLLSLARLQDQPGRCGSAATPRPHQAAAIRCKERMAAEPQMTAMAAESRGLSLRAGRHGCQRDQLTIDTRAGACGCVMVRWMCASGRVHVGACERSGGCDKGVGRV